MLWGKNTPKDFVRADTKPRQPSFLVLVADIRDERHVACSLNSDSKLTLMISAGSGDSSGKDLGALAYALSKSAYVFVIDMVDLISAELADLLVSFVLTEGLLRLRCLIVIHLTFLLLKLNCALRRAGRRRSTSPRI